MSTLTCEVSQNAPPACLLFWRQNPYRLVSLWDMLRFLADAFIKLLDDLHKAELEANGLLEVRYTSEQFTQRCFRIGALVADIDAHCQRLSLASARKQVKVIREWLESRADFNELHRMLAELRRRVREDLEDRVFYSVSQDRVSVFFRPIESGPQKGILGLLSPEDLFGADVCTNFRSIRPDLIEASKCLMFERNTACVFHLMRAMEVGLRTLGRSLNNPKLDPKSNPSWESILSKCDEELKLPRNKRAPEWQGHDDFFSEATANLRAVKDAWRNPTMHVENTCDYEEALQIWINVKSFLKHLALRLSE